MWDFTGRPGARSAGWVGARAAQASFAMAGLGPADVDVAEFYDPFSFEIIRQLEAYGFCQPGEGGPMVESGAIGPGGTLPVTTDGGTMSFSHPGVAAQQFQRVVRGASNCGASARRPRSGGPRWPCAPTAARGPCLRT